jgi:hypothetical protein
VLVRLAVALSSIVLLAGCSSGAGDASTKSFDSAQSVADSASLDNCSPDTEPEIGVTDAVTCDQGTVNWFKSSDALDGWAKLVKQMASSGLSGGEVLYGNKWAIECQSVADCQSIQSELGGKIR